MQFWEPVTVNINHQNRILEVLKYGQELLLLPLQIPNKNQRKNEWIQDRENGIYDD